MSFTDTDKLEVIGAEPTFRKVKRKLASTIRTG